MNLPNKLTLLRIILAPIFLALLIVDFPFHYIGALAVFIIASLTDMIDGKLARKYNLITDFGKFMDPLADKMLTTAAFIGFIELGLGYGIVWITMIVLTREFLITSLRLSAASAGTVIAANIWGKAKTVAQMVAIILTLTVLAIGELPALGGIAAIGKCVAAVTLWISAVLTVISGVIYMIDNGKFINTNK